MGTPPRPSGDAVASLLGETFWGPQLLPCCAEDPKTRRRPTATSWEMRGPQGSVAGRIWDSPGGGCTPCPPPPLRSQPPFCLAGEGGLEVRGHGDRPHLPLDVHHRLPAGHRGALPATLPGGDDLGAGGDAGSPPPSPGDPHLSPDEAVTVEDPWVGKAGGGAKGVLGVIWG